MKLPIALFWRQRSLFILATLGLLAAVRLWILPLGNSFWLDESLVVSIAKNQIADIGAAAYQAPSQSTLFCYVQWVMLQFAGVNEILTRLPSLLGAAGSAYVLYRIGAEFVNCEAGLIYAVLFVAFPQTTAEASNARPYALGLFFHLLALLTLLRWRRDGRQRTAIVFAVYTALSAYFHLFFLLAVPLEAGYLAWKWPHARRRLFEQAAWAGLVLLGCVLPLTPQTSRLMSMRRILEFPSPDDWFELVRFFFPIGLLAGCFLAWLLAFAPKTFDMKERDHLTLGFLLMVPALALAGASEFWHLNLLVPRYLLCSAPGVILVWGSCLRALGPPWVRRMTLAGGLVSSAAFAGGLAFVPDFQHEDWRSAVRNAHPSDRMLVYNGLAETRQLEWLTDSQHWDYLMAPVLVYQPGVTQANASLVPFEFTPEDREYMDRILSGFTTEKNVNVIMRVKFSGLAWLIWLDQHLNRMGFRRTRVSSYGRMELWAYQR